MQKRTLGRGEGDCSAPGLCDAANRSAAKTPRIAGQWREYLEIVFEEYWRSDRRMPHLFMSIAISELDEDEREALAHYYASER